MTLTPEEARRVAEVLLGSESGSPGEAEGNTDDVRGRLGPGPFGRYEIVRLVGVGGMGEVYEAQQNSPQRRVALKVIRPELVSPELRRRFEYESRTLARLQHPSIAKVFDAGQAESIWGRTPYFAMEFVEGQPLTDFARGKKLALRERLELFLRICEAVEHAHRSGVIHRDLKPGNVLVDEEGLPRVLDFGMARATDLDVRATTLHTEVGKLVGTLPYMSPEQVAGDVEHVDTRSDVYSLGVVLYELLAEKPPYEIKRGAPHMVHEAARVIREEDPTPLSSVSRTFRGDVETIVAKALEKEPSRRYQSVGEFAADIRRYLNDEPIVARRAGTWYQVRKFGRRNRALAVALSVSVVALLAATAVSVGMAVRASQAQSAAEQAQSREAEARELAELRTAEAERQASIARATTHFMETVIGSANPEALGSNEATVSELLDIASQQAREWSADDQELQAAIRFTVGRSYLRYGRAVEALEHIGYAADFYTAHWGRGHAHTLGVLAEMAKAYSLAGKEEAALELSREIAEHWQDLLGPDAPKTLRARRNVGLSLLMLDRIEEAAEHVAHLDLSDVDASGGEAEWLTAIHNLAAFQMFQGSLKEAERLASEGIRLQGELYGADDLRTAETVSLLSGIYRAQGRLHDAELAIRDAAAVFERINGPSHPATIQKHHNLAGYLFDQGKLDEAEALSRSTVAGYSTVLSPDHPKTFQSRLLLIQILLQAGEFGDGLVVAHESLDRLHPGVERHELFEGAIRRRLAQLLVAVGDVEAAAEQIELSFVRLRSALGDIHPHVGEAIEIYIELNTNMGRPDQVQRWTEALAVLRSAAQTGRP